MREDLSRYKITPNASTLPEFSLVILYHGTPIPRSRLSKVTKICVGTMAQRLVSKVLAALLGAC